MWNDTTIPGTMHCFHCNSKLACFCFQMGHVACANLSALPLGLGVKKNFEPAFNCCHFLNLNVSRGVHIPACRVPSRLWPLRKTILAILGWILCRCSFAVFQMVHSVTLIKTLSSNRNILNQEDLKSIRCRQTQIYFSRIWVAFHTGFAQIALIVQAKNFVCRSHFMYLS